MAYYYQDPNGDTQGPVPEQDLQTLHQKGELTDDTAIIGENESEWTTYAEEFLNLNAQRLASGMSTLHPPAEPSKFTEYKVILIAEGGCGTLLLGSAGIPVKKLEAAINRHAAKGWQVVFQVVENKRFLLFWTREAIIRTLGR